MSTRGIVGVRVDGVDKLTYNHSDSYPAGVGLDVLLECALVEAESSPDRWEAIRESARKLRLVGSEETATAEDAKAMRKWTDTGVSKGSLRDWYVLLRGAQGSVLSYLEAGTMIDNSDFINDGLSCEWAYIVNLDDMTLEVYRGFQRKRHDAGRYAKNPALVLSGDKYYPPKLVATFKLGELPIGNDFLKIVDPPDQD